MIAENLKKDASEPIEIDDIGVSIPMLQFNTTIISAILPTVFPLLDKDSLLLELLIRLRIQLDTENRGMSVMSKERAIL